MRHPIEVVVLIFSVPEEERNQNLKVSLGLIEWPFMIYCQRFGDLATVPDLTPLLAPSIKSWSSIT